MRLACLALLALLGASCGQSADLVVYSSLDQVHSEKIIHLFEQRTGLKVDAQYDVERNKTVGLVNRLLAERSRPRCDVYWNNEIANTLRLKAQGVTQAYASPEAEGLPASFRDPESHWTGFAARARVIMYREDMEGQPQPPRQVEAMADPQYAVHGAMARPLTGTTLSHFTVLSQQQGAEAVDAWFTRAEQAGLAFGSGNADVMRRVCEKDFAWCLTDTDDAAAARRNGFPVKILYPDQGGVGTMLIPNTVCMIAGARNPEAAKRFIDFVLSAEVEAMLAASDSEQIPLRPGVEVPDHVGRPGEDFQVMEVDWPAAAKQLEARIQDFEEMFSQ
ncbi:MAG: extracellular solute-binding protein [Planctomycetota bacterium]|nr:MAG: extracellular solute-binding protein [Planctomycetota bacterium]